jgi:hypothetical protein
MSISKILEGIDRCEIDHADGWWETSSGATFGREKLIEAQGYEFGLLSRIEALTQKLADAKQAARYETDVAVQAIADFEAMKLEAEALRKDAARYQWICDKGYNYHGAMAGSGSMSICRGPYILLEPPSHNKFSNMILTKQAANAIIDAAIAGEAT